MRSLFDTLFGHLPDKFWSNSMPYGFRITLTGEPEPSLLKTTQTAPKRNEPEKTRDDVGPLGDFEDANLASNRAIDCVCGGRPKYFLGCEESAFSSNANCKLSDFKPYAFGCPECKRHIVTACYNDTKEVIAEWNKTTSELIKIKKSLKDCICGGKPRLDDVTYTRIDDYGWRVKCTDCGIQSKLDKDKDVAIQLWNDRVLWDSKLGKYRMFSEDAATETKAEQPPKSEALLDCTCGGKPVRKSVTTSIGEHIWYKCNICGELSQSSIGDNSAISAWNDEIRAYSMPSSKCADKDSQFTEAVKKVILDDLSKNGPISRALKDM